MEEILNPLVNYTNSSIDLILVMSIVLIFISVAYTIVLSIITNDKKASDGDKFIVIMTISCVYIFIISFILYTIHTRISFIASKITEASYYL